MNIVPEQAHEESVEALLAFTVDKRQRNAEAARITEGSIIVKHSAASTSATEIFCTVQVVFHESEF